MTDERCEIITIKNMQEILGGACYHTAAKVMREVKNYSDRLEISGMIHKDDWTDFLKWRGEKNDKKNVD